MTYIKESFITIAQFLLVLFLPRVNLVIDRAACSQTLACRPLSDKCLYGEMKRKRPATWTPCGSASSSSSSSPRSVSVVVVQTLWLVVAVAITRPSAATCGATSPPPEASSTLLKMHRLYLRQPPHDTGLYDTLHVSPNATAAEIAKSYRRLSRRFHSDKAVDDNGSNDNNGFSSAQQLQRVRDAYEILKDDSTRLHYHRHGLLNAGDAVRLLTASHSGRRTTSGSSNHNNSNNLEELMRLMGFGSCNDAQQPTGGAIESNSGVDPNTLRAYSVAANLIETMRPVIEGALSEAAFVDALIEQCDRLKRTAFGAQILRCIGRAYRYSGQKRIVERRCDQKLRLQLLLPPPSVRDAWRDFKLLASAAVVGGRAVLQEQLMNRATTSTNKGSSDRLRIEDTTNSLLGDMHTPLDVDEGNFQPYTDDEIKDREQMKARRVLLESMQVEALWKVCKIDRDRTIRRACDLILNYEYFFYTPPPPPQQQYQADHTPPHTYAVDGWVGSTGLAIPARMGQERAARLLVLMGDIMVRRSKVDTAWME
jgi:curved DNA-binding protein CbpA